MPPITSAKPSPPRGRSPSSPTTLHVRSNIRSTSISMPSAISWNAASRNSSSSAASQPASKRPPEITGPSSLSQPSSYGCDKCPHYLGRIKLDRRLKTFEAIGFCRAARQIRARAPIDLLGNKDLVGIGDRLRPRRGVYHRADRGQVAMRPAEFPKTQFSAMNTNADPQFAAIDAQRSGELLALGSPAVLDLARSAYGTTGMIFTPDGEIEDSHDGVAN